MMGDLHACDHCGRTFNADVNPDRCPKCQEPWRSGASKLVWKLLE